MKDKLGYIGHKKPKDYAPEKYIAFAETLMFSDYYEAVGSLPAIILENEFDIERHSIDFLPFKVNIFLRDNIIKAVVDGFPEDKKEELRQQIAIADYAERMMR